MQTLYFMNLDQSTMHLKPIPRHSERERKKIGPSALIIFSPQPNKDDTNITQPKQCVYSASSSRARLQIRIEVWGN